MPAFSYWMIGWLEYEYNEGTSINKTNYPDWICWYTIHVPKWSLEYIWMTWIFLRSVESGHSGITCLCWERNCDHIRERIWYGCGMDPQRLTKTCAGVDQGWIIPEQPMRCDAMRYCFDGFVRFVETHNAVHDCTRCSRWSRWLSEFPVVFETWSKDRVPFAWLFGYLE